MSRLENIEISEIDLDVNNPRITQYVEFYDKVTDDSIKLALQHTSAGESSAASNRSTYTSLRESIRTQKGIIHPIIVIRKEDRYLVIEGNTRLSIYQDFHKQKVEGEWDKIPAIVYDSLGEKEIEAIRLQSHLVGPRDWEAYSKAKYLNYLRNSEHLTLNEIIDFCGGKKSDVLNYIDAYSDMETYYRPALGSDDQFDTSRFSAFVELQQKKGIKTAILTSGFTLTDFSKWVHNGLIAPLSTVRDLKLILSNEQSKEIFLQRGAKEALKVFDQVPIPDLNAYSIEQLAKVFYNKLLQLTYPEVKEMRQNPDSERVRIMLNIKDEIFDLCDDIVKEG